MINIIAAPIGDALASVQDGATVMLDGSGPVMATACKRRATTVREIAELEKLPGLPIHVRTERQGDLP